MNDLNNMRLKIYVRLKIYAVIGEASLCWNPKPEGVFDVEMAKEIGDKFMAEMESVFRELEAAREVVQAAKMRYVSHLTKSMAQPGSPMDVMEKAINKYAEVTRD